MCYAVKIINRGCLKVRKMTLKTKLSRILIVLIMVYVAYILIQQQISLNYYGTRQDYYKDEINNQKQELEALEKKQIMYDSDIYIEKLARVMLGYVILGEIVFLESSG